MPNMFSTFEELLVKWRNTVIIFSSNLIFPISFIFVFNKLLRVYQISNNELRTGGTDINKTDMELSVKHRIYVFGGQCLTKELKWL